MQQSSADRPELALDFMYARALRPMHASADDPWTRWCCRALYVRSHWLRMPPHLLAYHLMHKALRPAQVEKLDDDR